MPNVTGKDGRVTKQVDGVDTLVAGVKSWTIEYGIELIDTTSFQETAVTGKAYTPLIKDCTGSFTGNHTDEAEPLTVGEQYYLMLDVTSDLSYFGIVEITGKGASASINGEITQEYTFQYVDATSTLLTISSTTLCPPILILGQNVMTNGTFDDDTGWITNDWTIADGKASIDGSQTIPMTLEETDPQVTSAKFYYTNYQVLDYVAGNVRLIIGTNFTKLTERNANGYYTEIGGASSVAFKVEADVDFNGSVDNIVVREILNM